MVIFNSADDDKSTIKVSQLDIVYNNKIKACERPKISTSRDAYNILFHDWNMNKIELQEQFKVLFLDRGNRCSGVATIFSGGISATCVDLRLVFAMALKAVASGIILAHNHPSGNLAASRADIELTKQFHKAGNVLDVEVLDHLIITKEGYKSFADDGLIEYMPPMNSKFTR